MKKAGFWRRFWAMLIDTVIIGALAAPMGIFIHDSASQFSFWPFLILYNTLLLSRWGGYTIGKKILGIKVTTMTGEPLDWFKAFIRETSKILSAITLCIGYLWMLRDKNSQTWHDKIADTIVVEV